MLKKPKPVKMAGGKLPHKQGVAKGITKGLRPARQSATVESYEDEEEEEDSVGPIGRDPTVQRTVRRCTKLLESINIQELADEVMSKHAVRGIRAMHTQTVIGDQTVQLLNAELENKAFSSRVSEIKAQAFRISYAVHDSLTELKRYVRHRYAAEISKLARTQAERSDAIAHYFAGLERAASELEMLMGLCDILLSDYDQAGYTLKRINDVLARNSNERFT